jgi:three-Cys-motif partner protein
VNNFGGNWTYQKIQIIELYAKAYLQIMKEHPYWKLMYFDGFAGTGEIKIEGKIDSKIIEGAAKKVVSISDPRMFDMYYFVELDQKKAKQLKESLAQIKKSGIFIVSDDCNKKLLSLSQYLKGEVGTEGKKFKVLAFIDPCGMAVNWSSIEALKGLSIDMWILAPTGLGANRLLKKDRKISEAWLEKLEAFFGIERKEILDNFYSEYVSEDLFGNQNVQITKKKAATKNIYKLYSDRMKNVFSYISEPYELINRQNSVMFHLFLASNNKTAVKIANDIINKLKHRLL